MERKMILALAILSTILLASFALVAPTPPASAAISPPVQNRRYIVMGGLAKACSDLVGQNATLDWKTPFQTRPPDFMPWFAQQNITFSAPWKLDPNNASSWIVNLTVPKGPSYIGLVHTWYDKPSTTWYRLNVTLEKDGYGWIFLNDSYGDVDCYTFGNDTGVGWEYPSGKAGQLAALRGQLPSNGTDGVAGTKDDGFGDGTKDKRGSSILMLLGGMHVDYWGLVSAGPPPVYDWKLLFESPWPQVFTTGTSYHIVRELPLQPPGSENALNGWNSTETGQPWEFFAGLDTGYKVNYGHPKWNAYVTYVCAWSVLDLPTTMNELDVVLQVVERKVREDCVIGDVDGNELVDSMDILVAGLAFGAEDEGAGSDGIPDTGDQGDRRNASPNYDARGDISDDRGVIDSMDILVMGLDFGSELRPTCIWRPF